MRAVEHRIGGLASPGSSGRTSAVFDPATGEPQAQVSLASLADVDAAVSAASEAFGAWSQSSLARRAKVLFAFRELVNAHAAELASLITSEHGKLLSDAQGEVQRGLEVVEYACGIPSLLKGEYSDQVSTAVDSYGFRQPLGVVAGITPFNFPVMVPAWMYPIAIACGNTFVLKPSERVPSASNLVADLWSEAGLPAGVFNVVHGDKVAVEGLLDHPDIAAVSFVGSTPVAREVHRRGIAAGKRVQALGGAKNHAVVLPDADLQFAASHITAAAFGSAGQRCMAISVVVAAGDAADRLVDAIGTRARGLRLGPGHDPSSDVGPVVTASARDRIEELIGAGEQQGAEVAVDGRDPTVARHDGGFFVGPTVLDRVLPHMDVYTHEIFGPVLSVVRVNTADDAIGLINANPYGNGTAVFTGSGGAARRFVRGVEVGMVGVNVPVPVPMAYHSFGGWKASLFGDRHMHGPDGVAFYTRGKVVTARWPDAAEPSPASLDMPTAT